MSPADYADRFWPRVEKSDGCWRWMGAWQGRYGSFAVARGVRWAAHRAAWEICVGPIPRGLSVLHRCDNPPCVRPEHLWLGTQADNMHDMMTKGRSRLGGGGSGQPKLSEADVQAIRESTAGAVSLARQYGVTRHHIWKVRRGYRRGPVSTEVYRARRIGALEAELAGR